MSLGQDMLRKIDGLLAEAPSERAALALLREVASNLSAIRCDAEDLREETPFRGYPACDLFLVDGRDHCWKITQDPAAATGLVLAPKLQGGRS